MAAAAELGFARREMHSEKLAGTAPGFDHQEIIRIGWDLMIFNVIGHTN
jgi:hypothetical protein